MDRFPRRATRLLAVVVLAWLACATRRAAASRGEPVDVRCPVCAQPFEGWRWLSSNDFGGIDRDLCEHAAGDPPLLRDAWTCPRCAYSGLPGDWDSTSVPPALAERILRERPLRPALPIAADTRRTIDIPAWVRWDLVRQTNELRGDVPARARAATCLSLAWTQRFEIPVPPAESEAVGDVIGAYRRRARSDASELDAYRIAVAAAAAMVRDAADEGLALTPDERRRRLVAAALLYKSRGEDPDAARAIERLRASEEPVPAAMAALADEITARIAREKEALASALAPLEEARAEASDAEERAVLRYLAGEIHRKAGDVDRARGILAPLSNDDEVPARLRAWAADAVRRMEDGAGAVGR